MKLEIVNDTDLDISCDVIIDDKKYFLQQDDKVVSYQIPPQKVIVNLHLFKEDIWKLKTRLNTFFLKLYIMDLTFGNLSESNNLPFSIDYMLTIANIAEISCKKIFLSDIICIDKDSLTLWRKNSYFQCVMIALTIIFIGIILSFIFSGWHKLFFGVIILILSITVFIIVNKRRERLLQVLKTFL